MLVCYVRGRNGATFQPLGIAFSERNVLTLMNLSIDAKDFSRSHAHSRASTITIYSRLLMLYHLIRRCSAGGDWLTFNTKQRVCSGIDMAAHVLAITIEVVRLIEAPQSIARGPRLHVFCCNVSSIRLAGLLERI